MKNANAGEASPESITALLTPEELAF